MSSSSSSSAPSSPLELSFSDSSAPSAPPKTDFKESWKIQGLKMDLETERKEIQNLQEQLKNAELKNSIISQKMDIVECEKVEIFNDLVRNENEIKCQDMEIDQLEAGIRMAEKLLKEQKEQLEELRGNQKKEKIWNYKESWELHQSVKKNEKTCEKGFYGL
ncbi:hypothetical protein GCK72_015977 [Caenorhabditis remanei]|uniref:Uncharacterized protein n=1 Tax=Caenorhabditis remanei TaxID=31234 RepID=A0A6A5GVI2_CAERE|nr:hypothetical protein GCK72_015977 [Caenorhabditis remanei]KAF1759510.1 hypothetical protein GCK72_015977 [Caenorhabditis remanei]